MTDSLFLLQAQQGGFDFTLILLMMGIFLVVQFVIIGPKQKKREKQIKNFISDLQANTPVVLSSGIHGKYVKSEGDTMMVEIATGVKIKASKSSINYEATKALNKET